MRCVAVTDDHPDNCAGACGAQLKASLGQWVTSCTPTFLKTRSDILKHPETLQATVAFHAAAKTSCHSVTSWQRSIALCAHGCCALRACIQLAVKLQQRLRMCASVSASAA
jgi:hypothetical protein